MTGVDVATTVTMDTLPQGGLDKRYVRERHLLGGEEGVSEGEGGVERGDGCEIA